MASRFLIIMLCWMPATVWALSADQIALVVNVQDKLSRQIADYYQAKRHIPAANRIEVSFAPGKSVMSQQEFQGIQATLNQTVPASIQGYVLTWAKPYRVDCMSITTAFAMGFDPGFCAKDCNVTRLSSYAGSKSQQPFADYQIRPTMMLAAQNLADGKALIDRGIAADGSLPFGYIYLMDSPDEARNIRADSYAFIKQSYGDLFPVYIEPGAELRNKHQVLMVVTGAAHLAGMDSNEFVPGAIADHLTSFGGRLTDSSQTSALAWLQAGATGSYGTVMEPCNFPEKFPNPEVLLDRYLNGDTLLEAYWKSVAMPGQGVFIGEPLAAPFRHAPGELPRTIRVCHNQANPRTTIPCS